MIVRRRLFDPKRGIASTYRHDRLVDWTIPQDWRTERSTADAHRRGRSAIDGGANR